MSSVEKVRVSIPKGRRARVPRVLWEGPAEQFGVTSRDGMARVVDRGTGGVCLEYTLPEEILRELRARRKRALFMN